jgi:hypothetical protein
MEETRSYKSYPGWIVFLCNLVSAAIYAIGATILAGFGILVSVIPLVGGIILLIRDFRWPTVIMLAVLVALTFGGNALIRGSLLCKYCEQRKIGCPAAKLFGEKTA